MQENIAAMTTVRFSELVVKISHHKSNEEISGVHMSWAVEVEVVSIVVRRHYQLISESFRWKNQNRLQVVYVNMHE